MNTNNKYYEHDPYFTISTTELILTVIKFWNNHDPHCKKKINVIGYIWARNQINFLISMQLVMVDFYTDLWPYSA